MEDCLIKRSSGRLKRAFGETTKKRTHLNRFVGNVVFNRAQPFLILMADPS